VALRSSKAHFIGLCGVRDGAQSWRWSARETALAVPRQQRRSKKFRRRGNFLLHHGAVSPISQLTRREKKPDEAA